jgi:hypothetical protein
MKNKRNIELSKEKNIFSEEVKIYINKSLIDVLLISIKGIFNFI